MATIKASHHQADTRYRHGGLQCTAMCFAALLMHTQYPCESWNPGVMDRVLFSGNQVYESFLQRSTEDMMMVKELPESSDVNGVTYNFEIVKEYGGLLGQQRSEFGQPLYESFEAAFSETSNAFFVCGKYTILVLKLRDNCFAMFDSHARSTNGLPQCSGSAVLMFLKTLRDVEKHCRLLTSALSISESEQFEVVAARFVRNMMTVYIADQGKRSAVHTSFSTSNSVVTQKRVRTSGTSAKPKRIKESLSENNGSKTQEIKENTSLREPAETCRSRKLQKTDEKEHKERVQTLQKLSILRKKQDRSRKNGKISKKKTDEDKKNDLRRKATLRKQKQRLREAEERKLKGKIHGEKTDAEKKRDSQKKATLRKQKQRIREAEQKAHGERITDLRHLALLRKQEERRNTNELRTKDTDKNVETQIYDTNRLISKFKNSVSKGPRYVCTCCQQTWFFEGVRLFQSLHIQNRELKSRCSTKFISEDDKEWICYTCFRHLKNNRIPPCAIANKNCFPQKPAELDLTPLEERLVSARIPFMQIRERPRGRQLSLTGNVVNVPCDVTNTVSALPRMLNESETIYVKLKRKISYKHHVMHESIRPNKVRDAAKFLVHNSEMYKQEGITLNDNFEQDPYADSEENAEADTKTQETDDSVSNTTDTIIDDVCNVQGNTDTLLQPNDFGEIDKTIVFAPGQGNIPLGIFQDKNSEYLAFPSIYCGQARPENSERPVPIQYGDVCKWELRNVDRRVSLCVPNLFFKLKKIQIKQIQSKVSVSLRKLKGKQGKLYTAGELLTEGAVDRLVKLDEGYRVLKQIRASPPYWENAKKDLYAMLRQLGLPTFFVSLSAAETKWKPLLKILGLLIDKKTYSDEQVLEMDWKEKCRLIKSDPVTCSRYFDYRVGKFVTQILKSKVNVLGKVTDYFGRIEFQHRGSPHLHMLVWIENSPMYKVQPKAQVEKFIDDHLTCTKGDDIEELVRYQEHRCSRTCKKDGKISRSPACRFHYPLPPMDKTSILEPLDQEDNVAKRDYARIVQALESLDNVSDYSLESFLAELGLTSEQYIRAIQSSLQAPKVFLKRTMAELRINSYNKTILKLWEANIDVQFVLDPYACAAYIVSYISKGQRGMSTLLHDACEEVRQGNNDIKKQVRHIGNKFLGAQEVSAQEAAYLVLQLPLRISSRQMVFIPSAPKDSRTSLLKDQEDLQRLPKESTDITHGGHLFRYQKRPKALEEVCLAEFVARYDYKSGKGRHSKELLDENTDENEDSDTNDPRHDDYEPDGIFKLWGSATLHKRRTRKIIRYVRYNEKADPENFYREQLMLFYKWRTEETDILAGCETYAQRFQQVKEHVRKVQALYERSGNVFDDAQNSTENCSGYMAVAPSTEHLNMEDEALGTNESLQYGCFDPGSRAEVEYDLGSDLGLTSETTESSVPLKLLEDPAYHDLVNSLNKEQQQFFYHVLHHFKISVEPIYLFLSGGAGCGKTVVTKALYQALVRYLNSKPGSNVDELKVLLSAPTGKASYLINGNTLHSTFKIPANQSLAFRPLDTQRLNTLRTTLNSLKVLFIDEISMVGNKMFNFINLRLQEVMGSNKPFGGVSIIAVGDLFQLQPVMDQWIFQDLITNYGPLATNLWNNMFHLYELKTIMRQKEDKTYAELLNRLREAHHTPEDIELLKTRLMTCLDTYPANAVCLFTTNNQVDHYNREAYNTASGHKCIIPSIDTVLGDVSAEVKRKVKERIPTQSSKTMGLLTDLHVAVGLQYEVCINVSVEDGLTNGTSCVVKHLDFRVPSPHPRCSIVWCQFDKKVGKAWRKQNKHLYTSAIESTWTPVLEVRRQFPVGRFRDCQVFRRQFPLRPAAAKTIHKSQGDTVPSLVVDLGTRKMPHSHYVALSRVISMKTLLIRQLNEEKISVSDAVKNEMHRLRTEATLQPLSILPATSSTQTVIGFQNVRSLHKHMEALKSNHSTSQFSILGVAETKLKASDDTLDYTMDNFQIQRKDYPRNQTSTRYTAYGLAVYYKTPAELVATFSQNQTEFVILFFPLVQIQVAFLYISPTAAPMSKIKMIVPHILGHFSTPTTMIMGDFNMRTSSVEKYMEQHGYYQLIRKPTTDYGSCLDHAYINNPDRVASAGTLESHFSDHKTIFVVLNAN